jgi:hypothetical protein
MHAPVLLVAVVQESDSNILVIRVRNSLVAVSRAGWQRNSAFAYSYEKVSIAVTYTLRTVNFYTL